MGIISTIMGFWGFGIGISIGIVIGYFLSIFFQSTDVQDPKIRPLIEQDTEALQSLLPEIPLWVKKPDYDRVDWLNKFIEIMWPYLDGSKILQSVAEFLDGFVFSYAICKTVKNIVTPMIAEQIPNYKIHAIDFEELTLGSLPPTFQGIKVYETEEREIIMELTLKWAANPNVLVAVKAFGLRATVQIVDLQETIKDQVANMYLWPKTLEVQILDPAKAMKRPVGVLNVKVVKAMKLKKKDLLGASDPYVKLKLTEDKLTSKKTTVKQKNLNPEWNEEFTLVVKDPETRCLDIMVFDWEKVGKHDKMGINMFPLKDLTPEETKVVTLELLKTLDPNDVQNEKSRGQLVLKLIYKPFKEGEAQNESDDMDIVQKAPEGTPEGGGLLVVTVHEGQDL